MTGRPSGVSPHSASANASWTTSPGSSSCMAISSRITPRSTSTSSARHDREVTRSQTTSTASAQVLVEDPRVVAGVLLGGEGVHLAADRVHARDEISSAPRRCVPLNSRCSRKCDAPCSDGPLVAAADADPDAEGDRPDARDLLRDDTEPSRQDGAAHRVRCAAVRRRREGSRAVAGRSAYSAPRPGAGCVVLHRHEADLAALVDLLDLDLQLVADVDDVLDLADALAVAELADVDQAVLAGQQADERAEGGGLDDRAQEALADLRHGRVGDHVDGRQGRLGGGAVDRADVDRAVVLDGDVRTGVGLDLVDHLALRADDLADLVDRDLHRQDARSGRRHLVRARRSPRP